MKPLVYFDLETTGTNIAKDRIIDLAVVVEWEGENESNHSYRFNPGIPIPEEATAVHGITDEMVSDCSCFDEFAHFIHQKFFEGTDLAGFNILNFDVPLLWEEFNRCGIRWDLSGVNILDAYTIYRIKEERTLARAAALYCGEVPYKGHNAIDDARMTRRILKSQICRYEDLVHLDAAGLSKFCGTQDRVDLAGKIVRNKDGVAVYSFGKSRDVPVIRDPGFGEWMLRSDFSEQTKGVVRRLLNGNLK